MNVFGLRLEPRRLPVAVGAHRGSLVADDPGERLAARDGKQAVGHLRAFSH